MLETDEELQHALQLAYRYLNERERTECETRGHLERQAITGAVLDQTIGALTDQGYLDDSRYVRAFAQDKRLLEEWGSDRIRRQLLARGLDRDLVEAVLSDEQQESELERAVALLRRRFPIAPRDRRERDRALGLLIRKGYDAELALEALAQHARGEP